MFYDTYKEIKNPTKGMYKEKGSKFISYLFPVYSEEEAKEKLDMFFHYFNNFPDFYKWLVVGIFGAIYGLKPGIDLIRSNKK